MNIETNTLKQGPSLKTARRSHGCVKLRDESIIVAGGYKYPRYLKSTEILKIGEHEWKPGPDLKEEISDNKLVKSNRKDYTAYSIGGKTKDHKTSSKIYGLNVERNEWQLLDKMNVPRNLGSAVNVPSKQIPWCD